MITTIQIRDNIKNQLSLLKNKNQTYEDVIISLLHERESCKNRNIKLIKAEANVLNEINKKVSNDTQDAEDIGGELVQW